MVRVIPVYKFSDENAAQIEEPTAICIDSNNDLFFLALQSHCIEVHNLTTSDLKLLTIFPTVDLVKKILHCSKGNYLVTLESKCAKDKEPNKYVRVYVDWISSEANQVIRARIAGKVTPSLNNPISGLQMIELPLNIEPVTIACCQLTGNLLVTGISTMILYEFKLETLQPTKLKFIDFKPKPWTFTISFLPTHIEIIRDFISVMNNYHFLVFRLVSRHMNYFTSEDDCSSESSQPSSHSEIDDSSFHNLNSVNEKFELFLNWETRKTISNHLTRNSSSIKPEGTFADSLISPFIFNSPETRVLIQKYNSNWSGNLLLKNILRLKIAEGNNSCSDYFSASALKPLYLKAHSDKYNLESQHKYLHGITCSLCTSQEGYVYYFPVKSPKESEHICLATYTFTAPVKNVILEHTILHVLTQVGIESYTMRVSHHIAQIACQTSKMKRISPIHSHPVCLIGLKPLSGIEIVLNSKNSIVLISRAEGSCTLYTLKIPKVEKIFADILNAATGHKSSSQVIYHHLLEEAHAIVRLAKELVTYNSEIISESENMKIEMFYEKIKETRFNFEKIKQTKCYYDELYYQSCTLLGDYYIALNSELDWRKAIFYYKMSRLTASEVMLRKKSVEKQPGFVFFLKEVLRSMKSGVEADELFRYHNVIKVIEEMKKEDLVQLIIESSVLQEYATDKLIKLLESIKTDDDTKLALVLLYTESGREEEIKSVLNPISNDFLVLIILKYPHLLFDNSKKNSKNLSFSNFSGVLMLHKPEIFAEILSRVIKKRTLSFDWVLRVFLEYLPSKIIRDGQNITIALQTFIEIHLRDYFFNNQEKYEEIDPIIMEALKILVRSYLGKFIQLKVSLSSQNHYMNLKTLDLENINESKSDVEIPCEIIKLQSLITSESLPKEFLEEISLLLKKEKIDKCLSLKNLCNQNIEDVTEIFKGI